MTDACQDRWLVGSRAFPTGRCDRKGKAMANTFRNNTSNQMLADTIRNNSQQLTGSPQDYDSLLDMIADGGVGNTNSSVV